MRALTLKFFGMHKTKSISQYTSIAGGAEKFQIFQGIAPHGHRHVWYPLVSFGCLWFSMVSLAVYDLCYFKVD